MNTVYKIEVHQEAVVGPCKAIAPQSPLKFLERSPHLVLFFAGMDYRFIAKDLNVRNVSDPYENWPAFPATGMLFGEHLATAADTARTKSGYSTGFFKYRKATS